MMAAGDQAGAVFPTRVGVDRSCRRPRRCRQTYSPHAWGWTVGVWRENFKGPGIPHTRGGGPVFPAASADPPNVFPTRVGVDRGQAMAEPIVDVFPTRVGVDRYYG